MGRLFLAVVASATVVLAGCGGGGDGGAPPPPAPVGNFSLSATVGGVAVAGFSVANGGTGTLNVQTGQAVQLTSSGSVSWSTTLNGTDVVLGTIIASGWAGSFGTMTPRAVTLTATSTADATKSATVTINVAAGQSFALPAPQVGNAAIYALNDVLNDNTQRMSTYTDTTTAVNMDGSYVVQRTSGGIVIRTINNTASGDRASQLLASSMNLCSYTPARVYTSFPLHFGKSWNSTWTYTCAQGYRENAALIGKVVAQEMVTVPAGTFEALRVAVSISYTGSNDTNLVGGSSSTAQYTINSICWWGTSPVRFLGCEDAYSYTGAAPGNYLRTTSYKRM